MADGWNYADVWEEVAVRFPDEVAAVHGSVVRTWKELDDRADAVARTLLAFDLQRQDKVAQYMRNRPEYLESMFAAFKAALVPVNTNFRYGDDELAYLWDDADVAAVIFDAEFTETCARLRSRLSKIRSFLYVGPDGGCPDWALDYGAIARSGTSRPEGPVRGPWGRSGDDLNLLYTGGTTGLPKGVMWRQHDFFLMIEHQYGRQPPEEPDLGSYLSALRGPGPRVLPAPPLMHGTACWFAMAAMSVGGSVVTLTGSRFDPEELLDTVVARQVKGICIVGDAFAKPVLAVLDADPGRFDLRHVRLVMSSGAMLSRRSKERLSAYLPGARIVDGLGSSESGSLGTAVTTTETSGETARFHLGPRVRVLGADNKDVIPGSSEPGRLAIGGHLPLGYYKDPAKTAATFITVGDVRYVVAGDFAKVSADGSISLLGRGSGCINTAGEKVYPEEVEEALKTAAAVRDAAVVGVPDERFGEAVVALVEMEGGASFHEGDLIVHARGRLAGFKVPRRIIVVARVERLPNGKMDYRAMKEAARVALDRCGA